MKKIPRNICLILILLVFISGLLTASVKKQESPTKALQKILDEYWKFQLEENAYMRLMMGLPFKKMPDLTEKGSLERTAYAKDMLKRLQAIDAKTLAHEDWLSLKVLEGELEIAIGWQKYFHTIYLITPYSSVISPINRYVTNMYRFKEEKDLDNYLLILEQYPGLLKTILEHTREQHKRKIRVPKPELAQVVAYLETAVGEGDKSPFHVAPDRLAEFPGEKVKAFSKKADLIIKEKLNPAFNELISFIKGEYYDAAPERVGLWQYPGGKDFYRFLVRIHTTMDITPEEVHKIGLKEVKRLNSEIEKIKEEVGFKGDRKAFLASLKVNPELKPKTPEDIGKKLMFFNNKVKGLLPTYFQVLPKAQCGVKRLTPSLEAAMTFGYYQVPTPGDPKGYYMYNASKLEERNLLDSAALILHELEPGHHFQMAMQSENKTLPPFRQVGQQTAYIEGWAEYAAQLGTEMGLYNDPYDRLGMILQDLMMAVRLVVDTGMNYYGWTRAKASQFMRDNLLISDTEIATETLRYSVDIPGQALAYKIGSLSFWKFRTKVEKALGDKFDIRRFHHALLGSGSLPLGILDAHLDWFIKQEKKAKK